MDHQDFQIPRRFKGRIYYAMTAEWGDDGASRVVAQSPWHVDEVLGKLGQPPAPLEETMTCEEWLALPIADAP